MAYAEAALLTYLQANMPSKMTELRARFGAPGPPVVPLPAVKGLATAAYLPDVASWLIGDPRLVAVGKYPAVAVGGLDAALRSQGDDSYRVTYRLRAFVYVREQGHDLVHTLRNRLMLAVRELTLAAPGLLAVGDRVSLVRERMTESYSDVVDDGAGSSLAGAYAELFLAVNENLARPPGSPLADITTGTEPNPLAIGVTVRPSHPALD